MFFIFSTALSATLFILEEMNEILSQMCIAIHVKYLLFLTDLKLNLNFLDKISKNTDVSNFMKILPMGPELFYADETNSHLSHFRERAKK